MLNHFMMFADEASALSALAAFTRNGEWDTSRVLPGQRVVLARAAWDWSDPDNPIETSPEQTVPGYFVTVSLAAIDPALRDLPDGVCRLIGDGDTGVLVYTAPDLDPGLLATAIIEPVPAGAAYWFKH